MTIHHRAGRVHSNADPLSTAPSPMSNMVYPICNHITAVNTSSGLHQSLKAGYSKDKDFGQIYDQLMTETAPPHLNKFLLRDGIVYYTDPTNQHLRTCVPQLHRIRMDILHDHHDAVTAGHLGFHKSYNKIARVWPKIGQDVQDYIRSCSSCQQNKNLTNGPNGLSQPLNIPPQRWHTITMDFAGPFQPSGSYNQITVVVDRLSKRTHFIAQQHHRQGYRHSQQILGSCGQNSWYPSCDSL